MTGETGAGKSIIIGAVSLILGKRADLQSLKDKSKKCIIEGVFTADKLKLESFFIQHDLDFDAEHTIMRREILPSGKSRAFINDTPVSLVLLRELADRVVDLHSQNSASLLQSATFQLSVLDNFCKNAEVLKVYKDLFAEYKHLNAELESMKAAEKLSVSEQDFYQFQYDELEKAAFVGDEQQLLEEELGVLNHAEEIKTRMQSVINLIEEEHGLNEIYNNILSELKPLKDISNEFSEVFNRVESNYFEISDLNNELSKIDDKVELNPSRAEELNERVNLIYHLQQKHRAKDIDELIKVKDEYLEKINQHQSLSNEINVVEKQLAKMTGKLNKHVSDLSIKRHNSKKELEDLISGKMAWLGMPNAIVKLDLQKTDKFNETGSDKVTFLFNANKGGELQEMSKVASGGELSRLMLAIKSQIAASNLVSTIIFDEIDSGVSGEIAGKMATIMQGLSKEIQVISITHLPQIAARGEHHYFVSKQSDENTTTTSVRALSKKDRILEIAKMLSDEKITTSAMRTAEELLHN